MKVEDEANVRLLLRDLAHQTTLHGVKQIHDSKGPRRHVWLIALALAISFTVVLFQETVEDYLNYKTYIETQYVDELENLPFPTVTLCFSDNFVHSKFESFPASVTHEEYKHIFGVIHGERAIDKDAIALFDRVNITSYKQLVKSFHLTLEDTALYETAIFFNRGKKCSFSRQKCSLNELKLVWQMDGYRSCLQFNPYNPNGEPRVQTAIFSPFRIYLDLRAKYNKDLFHDGVYRYRKFTAYIHEYGLPHQIYKGRNEQSVMFDKLRMDPGLKHKFFLDYNEVNALPPPHGDCGKRKLKAVKYYPYSINTCIMDCQLQYILKECSCIRFDLKYVVAEDIPVCTTSQMVRCYFAANRKASRESEQCIKKCPHECNKLDFNINREQAPLPVNREKEIEEFLGVSEANRSLAEQYVKNQIIGVEVRYRRMRKFIQTFRPMVSLTLLLATIGGSIGLGMGLSILTLVEFCFFIWDSIKTTIQKKKKKRKKSLKEGDPLKKEDVNIEMNNGQ